MSAPRLPRGFPHRLATVPGWAGIFEVPRYIVRVDIDEFGRAGTHGWQVRYDKPWVFFGDTAGGKRRSPRVSLAAARRHLASCYKGPPTLIRTTPTRRKDNLIQEAGLRLVERRRRGRTVSEFYIEAVSPSARIASRRVYVGTERTLSAERIADGLRKARVLRAQMVAEHAKVVRF